MTEGLISELADTNVHVSIVYPGAIRTNITANSGIDVPGASSGKEQKFKAMDAALAANQMIDGMEKGKERMFIGKDSKNDGSPLPAESRICQPYDCKKHEIPPAFLTRGIFLISVQFIQNFLDVRLALPAYLAGTRFFTYLFYGFQAFLFNGINNRTFVNFVAITDQVIFFHKNLILSNLIKKRALQANARRFVLLPYKNKI